MYERFYGLKERPFSLTPDPDFLFMSTSFREALEGVMQGIDRREGFTVVVGEAGTGKTMLCWTLLGRLGGSVRTAVILNPLLDEDEILRAILQDFGIRPAGRTAEGGPDPERPAAPAGTEWMQGLTRKDLIDELNRFLVDGAERGFANVLLVDEAQNLSPGVLEQLRILSNLETPKRKLLQIIFLGQPELDDKLRLPELRQLHQRVTARYELQPLSKHDTARYIRHRLEVAGGASGVSFTEEALKAVHRLSRGYPRLVNALCDRALLAGYRLRSRTITGRMVRRAARVLSGRQPPVLHIRLIGPARWALPALAAAVIVLAALILLWNLSGQRWSFFSLLSGSAAP